MDGAPSLSRRWFCSSVASALGLPVAKGGCPRSAPRRQRSRCRVWGRAAAGREKPELHRLIRPVPSRPVPCPVPSRRDAGARDRSGAAGQESEDRGVRPFPVGRRDPLLAPPAVPAWEIHDLPAAAGVGPRAATGAKRSVRCVWPGWRGRCEPSRHRGRIPPGSRPLEGTLGPGSAHYRPTTVWPVQGGIRFNWDIGAIPCDARGTGRNYFFFLTQQYPGMYFHFILVRGALLSMSPSPFASFAVEATGSFWGKAKVIEGVEKLLNGECR